MRARSGGRDFQENILRHLAQRQVVTTLYLQNRMSVRGRILRYDPYVILVAPIDGGPPQMVYKSAIASVSGPRRGGARRPGAPRPGGPPSRSMHTGAAPGRANAPGSRPVTPPGEAAGGSAG